VYIELTAMEEAKAYFEAMEKFWKQKERKKIKF
jgi:hypothetical protein